MKKFKKLLLTFYRLISLFRKPVVQRGDGMFEVKALTYNLGNEYLEDGGVCISGFKNIRDYKKFKREIIISTHNKLLSNKLSATLCIYDNFEDLQLTVILTKIRQEQKYVMQFKQQLLNKMVICYSIC